MSYNKAYYFPIWPPLKLFACYWIYVSCILVLTAFLCQEAAILLVESVTFSGDEDDMTVTLICEPEHVINNIILFLGREMRRRKPENRNEKQVQVTNNDKNKVIPCLYGYQRDHRECVFKCLDSFVKFIKTPRWPRKKLRLQNEQNCSKNESARPLKFN